MELSIPGLMGAAIGLALGVVDYKVVSGVVEAKLRKLDRSVGAEKDRFEARIRTMRVLFMAMTVGLFPLIGYWLGVTVAGR